MKNTSRPLVGTRNHPLSGCTSPKKIARQLAAKERQKKYDALTTKEKRERCFEGSKQYIKLTNRLAQESNGN